MHTRALYVLMSGPLLAFATQGGLSAGKSPPDPLAQPARAEAPAAGAREAAATPRRSRLAAAGPQDRPSFHLTAVFIESKPDASDKDNCLQNTGTRLKREDKGLGACASANGVVYRMP